MKKYSTKYSSSTNRNDLLLISLTYLLALLTAGAFLGPFVDDEGIQSFLGSLLIIREPVAGLFALKLRPGSALISWPGAFFGWQSYLIYSQLLAVFSVVFLYKACEAIHGYGRAGALLLVCSPVYFVIALAGLNNVNGVFLACLGLYLFFSRRAFFLCGAVATIALLARPEYGIYYFGILFITAMTGRYRRVALGMISVALTYYLAGSLYHHNLLWLTSSPPQIYLPGMMSPNFEIVVPERHYFANLLFLTGMVIPAWPLVFTWSWKSFAAEEKTLLVLTFLSALAIYGLPFKGVMFFGHLARYWVMLLPFLAIGFNRWWYLKKHKGYSWPGATFVFVCGLFFIIDYDFSTELLTAGVILMLPAVVVAVNRFLPDLSISVTVATIIYYFIGSLISSKESAAYLSRALPEENMVSAVSWIMENYPDYHEQQLYTNLHQLDLYIQQQPFGFEKKVKYLLQFDTHLELFSLTNNKNGQYQKVIKALEKDLYGEVTWACDMYSKGFPEDGIFVLKDDYRLMEIYPMSLWNKYTFIVQSIGDISIRQSKPGYQESQPFLNYDIPSLVKEDFMQAPCR